MTAHPERASVRVRRAKPLDVERMAQLSGQLGYPSTPEQIARRLRQLKNEVEHAVYVAEAPGGEVVGWLHVFVCRLLEQDHQAEVSGLVVDETYRGRGVGQLLMEKAEQWARKKRCWAVRLRSNVIRERAHTFYDRLGYQMIKTQKVFRKTL